MKFNSKALLLILSGGLIFTLVFGYKPVTCFINCYNTGVATPHCGSESASDCFSYCNILGSSLQQPDCPGSEFSEVMLEELKNPGVFCEVSSGFCNESCYEYVNEMDFNMNCPENQYCCAQ